MADGAVTQDAGGGPGASGGGDMDEAPARTRELLDDPYDVAVAVGEAGKPMGSSPAERTVNTVMVPTRDLVITLERDESGDPLQSDWVQLHTACDAYCSAPLTLGSPGVTVDRETRRMICTFPDVPYGAHRVAVLVQDVVQDVIFDLVVRRAGVFAGGKKAGSALPTDPIAEPVRTQVDPPEQDEGPPDPPDQL